MAHTYKSLIEAGGCRVAYVWNVSGYPWAVCSDTAVASLLASPHVLYDAAYARRRIFGNAEIGSNVPAYDALVFDTLHPELGSQTTKTGVLGFCDVSGWSLKILDKQLGASWPHTSPGDEVWGIEGVHRVADLNDEIHGWGFLNGNVSTEATTLPIHEESADGGSGPLYDRIDAETEYKCVWIGHECVAVKSVASGSYPDYSATIVGRGLFRSKSQEHFTDAIEQVHQIISDVPQSIVGHYCWLWAIPLTPDGYFYRDADDNPIIALESARCGVVSESVVTDSGVTQIKIRPWTAALENKIEYETTENITGHVGRYTFCRGDVGTSWAEIVQKRQKPHAYIYEYIFVDDDPSFGYWIVNPIWLCPKNSIVQFQTREQLVEAFNEELLNLKLYTVSGGASGTLQNTGDGTPGNEYVGLRWEYHVVKDYEFMTQVTKETYIGDAPEPAFTFTDNQWVTGTLDRNPMWYLKQSSGGGNHVVGWHTELEKPAMGKWSMVGGVVQAILGLGIPHFPEKHRLPIAYRSKSNHAIEYLDKTIEPLSWADSDLGFGDPIASVSDDKASNFMEYIYYMYIPEIQNPSAQLINPLGAVPIIVSGPEISNHAFCVPAGLCQREEIIQFNAPEDFYCADSFLGWDWINYPASDWLANIPISVDGKIDTNGRLHLCENPYHSDALCWIRNTEVEQFVEGSRVKIGPYDAEVSSFGNVYSENYLIVDNDEMDHNLLLSNSSSGGVSVGSCLVTIPAYSLPSDAEDDDINDPTKIADSYDEDKDDPFRITIFREEYADKITDVVKAFLGYYDTGVWIPNHERRLFIPFARDDIEDGMVSFIDWDSFEAMVDSALGAFRPVVPHESFVLKTELDQILKMHGACMYEYWDSTRGMFRYGFKKYSNPVSSFALMNGRVITISDLVSGETVEEDHLVHAIFNQITLSVIDEKSFAKYDDEGMEQRFVNVDVHSVIDREIMNLKISPMLVVRRATNPANAMESYYHFTNLLYRLGDKKPTQTRGLLYTSRFRSGPGRESIITDPMARNPNTHRAGLVSADILITEQTVDLTKNKIKASFLVAGSSAVHGYAPSCRVSVSDVTVNADGFTCVPEEHYGSDTIKDIFFFDCFDVSDPDNPTPRADSCGNYAVRVYAQDYAISADNPIVGTCAVFSDAGVWKLRVYCDESKLPGAGDLIITYDVFDNCESDQKTWMFFSDENGRVGTTERKGDVWG